MKMGSGPWKLRDYEMRQELIANLDACQTFDEAAGLLRERPPPDSPGRLGYTSLDFFLQERRAPLSASSDEIAAYLRLVDRAAAVGHLDEASAAASVGARTREP
jgi:hypothetical protein